MLAMLFALVLQGLLVVTLFYVRHLRSSHR